MDGFRFSKDFKGPTTDLVLYMERVALLTRAVVEGGDIHMDNYVSRAMPLEFVDGKPVVSPQAQDADDIEGTVVLYQTDLESLRNAAQRVHDDPERYSGLVEWRERPTLHGVGRPTVEEALFETWIMDFEEYRSSLSDLIDLRRSQGRIEEAEHWKRRQTEGEDLERLLGEMTRASIQR